jgi:hypothetical protein
MVTYLCKIAGTGRATLPPWEEGVKWLIREESTEEPGYNIYIFMKDQMKKVSDTIYYS